MDDIEFDSYVESALESLPLEFRDALGNVSIIVRNWPSREQLAKTGITHGLMLGLYEGTPRIKGGGYRQRFPDVISLFKYPILIASRTRSRIISQIRSTLIHEIAHHFGMDEEEVRSAESEGSSYPY